MDKCSEQDDIAISSTASGHDSDESLGWMKGVLAEFDKEDDTRGAGGGDDEVEGCWRNGLGRRMECFESVEAEGREMWGRYVGVAKEEGQEVPTRVLFDRRVPTAATMTAAKGARGESGGGSVERERAGKEEVEMEIEREQISGR